MSIIPKCPICWGECKPGKCEARQQPEALRLADELTTLTGAQKAKRTTAKQAADELRRLHAENEALRGMSFDTKRDMETETLLRQALEMMEESHYAVANQAPHADVMAHFAVIEALRERLGEKT